MNLDNDIKIAILFDVMSTEAEFPVFFPVKPMIGRLNESEQIFTDILTGEKVLSVENIMGRDEEECFNLVVDVEKLLRDTGETKIENAIRKLWSRIDGKAFVCGSINEDLSNPMMFPLDDSEFQKLFGYNLSELNASIEIHNKVIEDYVNGIISEDDYEYFLENSKLPEKAPTKIIKVDFRKNK